jgi:D-alanine-D-alanine ligase
LLKKFLKGENILSASFFNVKLNVALAFNVKPESDTFPEIVPPNSKNPNYLQKKSVDTFAEWDTWDTINAVKGAIECFHNVNLIEADQNAYIRFMETRPDIVFNIAEGFNGVSREAQIPVILDMLNIPYTGSDPLTLATCLDKARTKEILSYYRIPNAKFVVADSPDDIKNPEMKFPLIVKPVSEGSGKGIFSTSFVENTKDLMREVERITSEYGQSALIEEFLPGREFTAAVMGNGREAEVFPIVEINYKDFPDDFIPIYSYEAKWILDTKENPLDVFHCPAKISSELEKAIKENVLRTYHTLRCRDWSRIDLRLDDRGTPNIIEVNPLPGILPNPEENSCYPKAARTAGINYNDMINKVLFAAVKRHNLV